MPWKCWHKDWLTPPSGCVIYCAPHWFQSLVETEFLALWTLPLPVTCQRNETSRGPSHLTDLHLKNRSKQVSRSSLGKWIWVHNFLNMHSPILYQWPQFPPHQLREFYTFMGIMCQPTMHWMKIEMVALFFVTYESLLYMGMNALFYITPTILKRLKHTVTFVYQP